MKKILKYTLRYLVVAIIVIALAFLFKIYEWSEIKQIIFIFCTSFGLYGLWDLLFKNKF